MKKSKNSQIKKFQKTNENQFHKKYVLDNNNNNNNNLISYIADFTLK